MSDIPTEDGPARLRAALLALVPPECRREAEGLLGELTSREGYLADYDGLPPQPFSTPQEAMAECVEIFDEDEGAVRRPWDWFVSEGGWEMWFTDPDTGRPTRPGPGRVIRVATGRRPGPERGRDARRDLR